jgi:hypothetical protein
VRLGDVGVGRRPLASVVAENLRDRFIFIDLLRFYLQSFQDNHFILVCLLVFTYVAKMLIGDDKKDDMKLINIYS